jgi:shikimate kinase
MTAKNQIIYIIGFMGSGKTTAGKRLASLLGWKFIDLDRKIEEYAGKTIPEIFSQNGEQYFRTIESQLLRDLKSCENTIISTGGGTPCHRDNMDFMLGNGLTLYLKLTPSQINSRLSESKGDRPLIDNLDSSELMSFIEAKLGEREEWYSQSDITVNGINLNVNELLSVIQPNLKK